MELFKQGERVLTPEGVGIIYKDQEIEYSIFKGRKMVPVTVAVGKELVTLEPQRITRLDSEVVFEIEFEAEDSTTHTKFVRIEKDVVLFNKKGKTVYFQQILTELNRQGFHKPQITKITIV